MMGLLKKYGCKKMYNNPYDDGLETDEEYRQRWSSIYIIYFTMFLMSLGFSIVLTGAWPYLDKLDPSAGKTFMGYVVGANPFAQMLFSPLLGWWCNRLGSIRLPLICTLLVFIASSSIYSSLELFSDHRKYWMMASRFLVGVSSANTAALRSYLSAATRINERRNAITILSLSQVLGFVFGPALQAAVVPLGSDGIWLIKEKLKLDMYTATGWINVILSILNLCLFLPACFEERLIASKEAMKMAGVENEKDTWKSIIIDKISVVTLIVMHFVLVFNFMIMETLGTSLAMDEFGWTKAESIYFMGILLSIGALLTCASFVFINVLCRKYSEVNVMIWVGFLLMVVGRLCYLPWGREPPLTIDDDYKMKILEIIELCKNGNLTGLDCDVKEPVGCPLSQPWCASENKILIVQFVAGSMFCILGFPIALTLLQTIFSKILGTRPQGTWMGLMTGSGSLSRVLGPVLMMYIYTNHGPTWTFGLTSVMLIISFVWVYIIADKLMVMPKNLSNQITELEKLKDVKIVDVISEK